MSPHAHTFTQQIRQAISGSGISNAAISQQIGVSPALLSRFANGHVGLSLDTLDRLAKLLDLRITVGPDAATAADYPDRRRKAH